MSEIKVKVSRNKDNFSFSKILQELISDLTDRSQEIVAFRYGLGGDNPKTLEEIGSKYDITRERVRQIIREALKKVSKKKSTSYFSQAESRIKFTIREKSGIIREDELLSILGKDDNAEKGAIRFFLDVSDEIDFKRNPGILENSISEKDFNLDEWHSINEKVKSLLEDLGNPVEEKELFRKFEKMIEERVDQKSLINNLSVSGIIKRNSFGKWGLRHWDEISPKGTREKAYLVLKESGEPLYFKKIAELIDEYKLSKKKTNAQTVHNELIKDERFVLIGRGIYALSEWGYKKGTVKDLLEEILKKSQKPMKKEEILKDILSVRQVKKSTVIINLNNFFSKVGKDQYTVRG